MFRPDKISIVGVGKIGAACAFAILLKKLVCQLALVDQNESKVIGESMDLLDASTYFNNAKILASTDYGITSKSVVCIVTVSTKQQPDELEQDFINRYVDLYRTILPKLVSHSPDTKILVVGNPIGILTFAAWKISRLPKNRIFGIASSLDTSVYRCRAAAKLGIATNNVIGWAIEKNLLFSSLTVAGVKLSELETNDLSELNDYDHTKNQPHDFLEHWAIAFKCTDISAAIIKNSFKMFSVAVCAKGCLGISGDVFLSLPCLIGRNGIKNIINLSLSNDEMQLLQTAVAELDRLNLKIVL